MGPDVAVCVITWNSADCIERCLDALFAQTQAPAEVVVVDNASSDDTLDRVSRFDSRILVIRNERNLGFAAAANQAYRATSAPLFGSPGFWRGAKQEGERVAIQFGGAMILIS